MGKLGLGLMACLVSFPCLAGDGQGAGFDIEASRFRNELRDNQHVLSPGIAGHLETEMNRLERYTDREQAARELRALERDTAYAVTGLPGAYAPLTAPTGSFPNVYAPSDTISSPSVWRLPQPGDSWR